MSRRPRDFYETDPRLTEALLNRVAISGRVFEPCAGDLAIARLFPDCLTNDIDLMRPTVLHFDATIPAAWPGNRFEWVVTNPPFGAAAAILPIAYEWAKGGVAMLLRLSFLEPANGRGAWLQKHSEYLSDLIIFNPRPSFTGNGSTDSVTAAWMVWRKAVAGGTRVHFVTGWRDAAIRQGEAAQQGVLL